MGGWSGEVRVKETLQLVPGEQLGDSGLKY